MKRLTKKEKGFVKDYLDTGNGTIAVKRNYDRKAKTDDNVAGSIASQNLGKLKIQQAIMNHAQDAESMIYKLSQTGEQEPVRLGASKDIMDRAGFKPVERSESKSFNVGINLSEEGIKELKKIADKISDRIKQGYAEGVF